MEQDCDSVTRAVYVALQMGGTVIKSLHKSLDGVLVNIFPMLAQTSMSEQAELAVSEI